MYGVGFTMVMKYDDEIGPQLSRSNTCSSSGTEHGPLSSTCNIL